MNIQSDKNQIDNSRLFIKKFKTPGHHYIYDVNSNGMLKVNEVIWDVVDQFSDPVDQILRDLKDKHSKEDILGAYDTIGKAKESGSLGCHRPVISSNDIRWPNVRGAFENLGIQQLILDLTNQCNLRCKYCIFSGKYKYKRIHTNKAMTRECAMKAVDFFMEHVGPRENPSVTFYGGETLLEFELIKDVIENVKSKQKEKKYVFALTTNGTLINQRMIAFFVENNFSLFISLDGPKDIHDRNRVRKNSAGTFDSVMNNLQRIKEYSPQYFADKVSYLSVLTPPYDFDALQSFFYNSELFKSMKNPVRLSNVNNFETTYLDDMEETTEKESYKKFSEKVIEKYKDALVSGQHDEPGIEKELLRRSLVKTIHFRAGTPLKESHAALGQCTPGLRRLFINPDGNFYMCEKVGEHYPIGNLEKGLDFERITQFFLQWDEFFKDCGECWALRFCQKCFSALNRGDQLDLERKEAVCDQEVVRYERLLSLYCEILEKNPDAFKHMDAKDYL